MRGRGGENVKDNVTPLLIAGERFTGDQSIIIKAPHNGAEIGRVPSCTSAEVDRAVAAARAVLRGNPLPAWRRAEILDGAARTLAERKEEFARTLALEACKPIRSARVEVERAVGTFQFAAAEARKLAGEMVPMEASAAGDGKIGFTMRVPIGVIGAITPFNFPVNLVAHKIAPAIAAGCPVVLKPAPQTPFSAIKLAGMLIEQCQLPAAYLSVITGDGAALGKALVAHPGIEMISFTGSAAVGWDIRAQAPRKRVALELGNNSPVVIDADGDWRTAAAKIKVAGFGYAGQTCVSAQRIYVHEAIAGQFSSALIAAVESLVVGEPLDERTDVAKMISESARDRVLSWIREAVGAGAKVLTGGEVSRGILQPTILSDVTPDMKVCRQEVFGPVVTIQSIRDLDEGIRLSNDTSFGLQAAVFTSDIGKALKAARTLEFGAVLINEVPTWRTDQMPYGGIRESGNTREGPSSAVLEMTEIRLIVINP